MCLDSHTLTDSSLRKQSLRIISGYLSGWMEWESYLWSSDNKDSCECHSVVLCKQTPTDMQSLLFLFKTKRTTTL